MTPVDPSDWPNAGYVLIEAEGANPAELVRYLTKASGQLALSAGLASAHGAGAIINFVDYVVESAEVAQRRFKLTNFPAVRNSERIWTRAPAGTWALLTRGVDYALNRGTGEFQLTDVGGVVVGTQIVAHYTYYTNLIAEVQRVMEGDLDDTSYPGVKAAGIMLSVEQPVIKRVPIVASITAAAGFVEADIAPAVRRAIESYISSLRIGEDVIISRIIDTAFFCKRLARYSYCVSAIQCCSFGK
ncbi:hypothetical protein HC928_08320 [bacterium]|nr:hypothetical protein [bacterium]